MIQDPEQSREPWDGTVVVRVDFRVQIDHDDDVVGREAAEQAARERIESSLRAIQRNLGITRFIKDNLADFDVVDVEADVSER